jgi:predicted nucleic acid-binding protein
MIVYVESNFVLELAYLQEQLEDCRAIVELAEAGSIHLVLPAFSISEPYESFVRRYKERRALLDRLQRETRELSRSQPYTGIPEESTAITATFVRSLEEEKERLDEITLRIVRCAESIPTTADVLARAIEFQRGLIRSPQDAIVYASVLSSTLAITRRRRARR